MYFLKKLAEKITDSQDSLHKEIRNLSSLELSKTPTRTEIINFLIDHLDRETNYLEIGVRNPDDNFNHIKASKKYSVDPGVEFELNPVDFKMTSDEFFDAMRKKEVLNGVKFDLIFVDGLHLADQAARDIENSLEFLKNDGYVLMHDCNPPSEWHAREFYSYKLSPAGGNWNGTTWKAFAKARQRTDVSACCIDSDWGVGIISKSKSLGDPNKIDNPFFEYLVFEKNRAETLNLVSYETFKEMI